MNIAMLLQMAADLHPDRTAVGARDAGMSCRQLLDQARRAAEWIRQQGGERLVTVDVNSPAVPVLLFGSALAGVPFVPVNYRLADDRLRDVVARTAPSIAVVDEPVLRRIGHLDGVTVRSRAQVLDEVASTPVGVASDALSENEIAVLLFTSGTTGEPKAAVLRHQNLFSYIVGSVEFGTADEDECALVSVPPYHVAGVAAVLSNIYSGRRLYYLEQFDPAAWVDAVRTERVTHAMVVPTMLVRILDVLDERDVGLPTLRSLSYGGGRMPVSVIERALARLDGVDFVNAYGLTETSSTITVLTPEDHRAASTSDDPSVRRRLGSVGRPLPGIELEIRDAAGRPVPTGVTGEIWVRGAQVSGEYVGAGAQLENGWFHTRDSGWLDDGGYLFLEGRVDDVIVRGGENMSPGEIEDVLLDHPDVDQVAVVGIPDREWGEAIAAFVVPRAQASPTAEELREWVRARLRSSRVPTVVEFRDSLPYTETGKLLRRTLRDEYVRRHETADQSS